MAHKGKATDNGKTTTEDTEGKIKTGDDGVRYVTFSVTVREDKNKAMFSHLATVKAKYGLSRSHEALSCISAQRNVPVDLTSERASYSDDEKQMIADANKAIKEAIRAKKSAADMKASVDSILAKYTAARAGK